MKLESNYLGAKLAFFPLILGLFIALVILRVDYWIKTPEKKFAYSLLHDLSLLKKSGSLPSVWNDIKEISLSSDQSPAAEWIKQKQIQSLIPLNKSGRYKLQIYVMHWIEKYRYGAIVQFHLVDTKLNDNTIWELGRTFKLGIIY